MAPKGWRFRSVEGNEVYGYENFVKRFKLD